MRNRVILPALISLVISVPACRENKADKLILGNIITMDAANPGAEAMTIKDGKVQFVGDEVTARKYCNANTEIVDYKTNTVYPGFCESHAHGVIAASRLLLEADLSADANSMQDYVDWMKKYIEDNPGREVYRGSGWSFITSPDARMLDAISPDVPVVLNSVDGHSLWVNTAAMQKFGIDKEFCDKMGHDVARVRQDGTPSGYLSETAMTKVLSQMQTTKEEIKQGLLKWQEFAFSHGFTATSECYVNPLGEQAIEAYRELESEGKWKLRTYAVFCIVEDEKDVDGKLQRIVDLSRQGGEHFSVNGVKLFLDGVVEAHTGWLFDPYSDQSDYYGLKRGEDVARLEKMVRYINEKGLSAHFHAIGDGAVKAAVDAICAAEDQTGIKDARNIIAHLQVVRPEDIRRMGEYNIMAAVAPLWVPMEGATYQQMIEYIGEQRSWDSYPIRSFIDAGSKITFHTDYPVSPSMSIPRSVYCAVTRTTPELGMDMQKNPEECITREQSLEAMTLNPAYQWRQEGHLGCLSEGAVANYTVYNADFLHDELDEVAAASLICTAVDGEVVFQ